MRYTGIWTLSIMGGLALAGTVLAQTQDDDAPAQNYQAPGVHVWVGRYPSKAELQSVLAEVRAQSARRQAMAPDKPDFQDEHVAVWVGKRPSPETLRNLLRPNR